MRWLTPGLAGITTFLLTCPLLLRGGSSDGDIPVFRHYGDLIAAGQVPYRDFKPEYPPGALPIFALPSLLTSDRHYLAVFRLLAAAGVILCLGLLALLLARLGMSAQTRYAALVFSGLAPLMLGAFVLRRFDMWPTAICLGVLLLLVSDRPVAAFALLGLGAVVKVYPLILLPLALLAVDRSVRVRAVGAFCAVGVVLMGPFALLGHAGLYNSLMQQANRHLHLDTVGSSILLALHRPVRLAFDGGGWSVFGPGAGAAASAHTLAQVAGIAGAAVLFARSERGRWDLMAAAATTLAAGAFLGKVLSPQFLLWVAPAIVLARAALPVALFTAAMLATNVLFPDRYEGLLARHDGEIWLLVARNALLVATLAALFACQARWRPSWLPAWALRPRE